VVCDKQAISSYAGIYALDHNIPQLKVDNMRAKAVGQLISSQDYVTNMFPVKTNIIIFELEERILASHYVDVLKKMESLLRHLENTWYVWFFTVT
jgi:threonine aldolase